MALTIKDIETIESYLLDQLSLSGKKRTEIRIEQDAEFAEKVDQIRITILAIQEEGKRIFKKQMIEIQQGIHGKYKDYSPGSSGGAGSTGLFAKTILLITGFIILAVGSQFLKPELEQPHQQLSPIVDTLTNTNATPVKKKATIKKSTNEQAPVNKVTIVKHITVIDTVIEAGQEFDIEAMKESLSGDSIVVTETWEE